MMLLLLTDGRFAFLCEGSYVGLSDSWVSINYKIIFASSLQMLLFFALGDYHRMMLGINIGVKNQSSTVPLSLPPPLAPSHSLSLAAPLTPLPLPLFPSRFISLPFPLSLPSLLPSRSLSLSLSPSLFPYLTCSRHLFSSLSLSLFSCFVLCFHPEIHVFPNNQEGQRIYEPRAQ